MSGAVRTLRVGPDAFPYVETGTGRTVLFLHGAPGDHRMWARQLARLADRYRTIAFTQRWFGTAEWREDGPPFGPETHANDLIDFVEALGTGPVALVAWSYAGHVAFAAALARPDLFERLLVYEPGFPTYVTDPEALDSFGCDAGEAFRPIVAAAQAGDNALAVRRLIEASGGPGAFEQQDEMRRRIQLDSAGIVPRLLSQPPPPAIGCEDLARLSGKAVVAWGSRSRPIYAIPSRAAARCIGGAGHLEVPDAGHLWPDEDPDGFAALVERWLAT